MIDSAISKLPDWQKGWIAGMIDGEGTMAIHNMKTDTRDTAKARIAINLTHSATVNMICNLTQMGNVKLVPSRNETWKDSYMWQTSKLMDVHTFLKELSRYMFTKRQQADMVLEWCEGRLSGLYTHNDEYYYKMSKQLNKRGRDTK